MLPYLAIAALVMLLLLMLQVTGATTIIVSPDDSAFCDINSVIATGTAPSISCAMKVAQSQDTIMLASGNYTGVNNTNICADGVCPQENVRIIGSERAGVIISCDAIKRNVRAIVNELQVFSLIANITFRNCNFIRQKNDTLSGSEFAGGAIIIRLSSTIINNCLFVENSAESGGAISVATNSNVTIINSDFIGNHGNRRGGAISVLSSSISILNSTFSNNFAKSVLAQILFQESDGTFGLGGAVYFSSRSSESFMTILDSNFVSNNASVLGGALFVESLSTQEAKLTVNYTNFISNFVFGSGRCFTSSCLLRGGAVYMSIVDANFNNCTFLTNHATVLDDSQAAEGGALFSKGLSPFTTHKGLQMKDCDFILNTASNSAGAVYIYNQMSQFLRVKVLNNTVGEAGNSFSDITTFGGGVYISSVLVGSIFDGCIFRNNLAFGGWGGGLFIDSSEKIVQISQSEFTSNVALSSYSFNAKGGAIMASVSSLVSISDSTFNSNLCMPRTDLDPFTLSGTGGAIFAQSMYMNITSSLFDDNVASSGQFDVGSIGGAIIFENVANASISKSTFRRNGAAGYSISNFAAAGSGGALALKFSGVVDVNDCDFINNWVSSDGNEESLGGAVVAYFDFLDSVKQRITFTKLNFINNSALGQPCFDTFSGAGSGGAISIIGVSRGFSIVDSTFSGNIAFSPPSDLVISTGGAISMSLSSNLSTDGCIFEKNQAINGEGNDVASFSGNPSNMLAMTKCFYHALRSIDSVANLRKVKEISAYICSKTSKPTNVAVGGELRSSDRIRSLYGYDYNHGKEVSLHDRLQKIKRIISLRRLDNNDAMISENHLEFLTKYELFLTSILDYSYDIEYVRAAYLGLEVISMRETYAFWQKPSNFISSAAHGSKSRRLSPFNSLKNGILLQPPGILVASGIALINSPTLFGNYFIFIGNIGQVLQPRYKNGFSGPCSGQLFGHFIYDGNASSLSMAVLDSSVSVANAKPINGFNSGLPILLTDLAIVNSTMKISNKVTVKGNATLIAANIENFVVSTIFQNPIVPSILFLRNVFTSFAASGSQVYSFQLDDDFAANLPVEYFPFVRLKSVNLTIAGNMMMTSTLTDSSEATTLDVFLLDSALLAIADSGALIVSSPTTITSDNSSSCLNNGTINLRGDPLQKLLISDSGAALISGKPVSLVSPLTINGHFIQTETARVFILLNTSFETLPVLYLDSNFSFLGDVILNFTKSELGPEVQYSSIWSLIQFKKLKYNPAGTANFVAPQGLAFTSFHSETNKTFGEYLQISSISCDKLLYYYAPSNEGKCTVCLQNTSCNFCSSQANFPTSTSSGVCIDSSEDCPSGFPHTYDSSCCENGCNGVNGNCQFDSKNLVFQCNCNTWFSGDDCSLLNTEATVLIAAGVFFVFISVITLLYYRYSRNQKKQVLDELTQGLLNDKDMGASMAEGRQNNQQSNYIRAMQQALVLKDVFVKFEDIKMESKIGEGSFGVVYKAMFRGAQVAVKQMRSMYLELTEDDIAEFKKEAYMMSRLRHPNIVLVMGISFVEQEAPMVPPKKRFATVEQDVDPEKEKEKEKAKSRPKTICIITEYLEQGSLADILYGPTKLPAEVWNYELILTLALQAARGMLYLHSNVPAICHRDLKSSNLVVDDHFVVKVTDFGMSRIVPEKLQDQDKGIGESVDGGPQNIETSRGYNELSMSSSSNSLSALLTASNSKEGGGRPSELGPFNPEMTSNLGTTAWCAPELLTASSKTRYSIKVDVYSFGMVLWELWERKRPFDDLHSRFDIVDAIRSGKRPPVSDSCPPAYRSLMQRCWQTDPTRRPTFQYICRYIKDELARVKRQKNAGPAVVSYYTNTNTPIPTQYPDVLGISIEDGNAGSDPIPTMRNSLTKLANAITSNLSSSNNSKTNNYIGSGGGNTIDLTASNSSGSRYDFSPDGNVQITPVVQNASSSTSSSSSSSGAGTPVYSTRAPLVNAAGKGDFSDLASSPLVTSSLQANMIPYRHTIDSSQLINENSSNISVASGGRGGDVPKKTFSTANNRTQQPTQNQSGQNQNSQNQGQWRDKYVMKLSGWKASQPDVGLPPSMVGGGGGTTSTAQGGGGGSGSSVSSNGGQRNMSTIYNPIVDPTSPSNNNSGGGGGIFPLDDEEDIN